MFDIHDIANITANEFLALKRWDEYLSYDLNAEIDRTLEYSTLVHDQPATEHQKNLYRKTTKKHYAKIGGIYLPPMTDDILKTWVERHKLKERYGIAIACAIAYRRMNFSNKIIYMVDHAVARYWSIYQDGFLRDRDVVTFIRRGVRLVIGHERRHKSQTKLHNDKNVILLHCDSPTTPVAIAKEQDADWFAWQFNRYHFGDQVMEI